MKHCVSFLAAALLAQGQDTTRLVEIRSVEATRLDVFLSSYGVRAALDPSRRFAVLRGTPEQIGAAEEALKRIQVPSRNIDLTFQVIVASQQAGADKLPQELDAAVNPPRVSTPSWISVKARR